ncbi:MAG: hypothetical protein ACK56I_09540 [bacterium]
MEFVFKEASIVFIFLFEKAAQKFQTIRTDTEKADSMFGALKIKYSSHDPLLFNVKSNKNIIFASCTAV